MAQGAKQPIWAVASHLRAAIASRLRSRPTPTVEELIQGNADPAPVAHRPSAGRAQAAAGIPTPPRRVAHFVLLERLGAGGMGVVYAAYDERLERKVAIKLVHPEGDREHQANQQRLLREAQALARLTHPNVVTVYEVGVLPAGGVFIAMELVKGTSLRHWQEVPGRHWREILECYLAAAAGLVAAHRAGVVHRDVKPDNILVGDDGRVRVVDFGLACAAAPATAEPWPHPESTAAEPVAIRPLSGPRPSIVGGTPGYMAPEQRAFAEVDPRSDQFSFCAALYEALYGELPYAQTAACSAAAPQAHRPTPRELHAHWLWEALERGLAPDPQVRFPSMEALVVELSRAPGRTPGRVGISLAVAALVALTSTATLHLKASPPPCAVSPAELTGIWDGPQKRRVAQALRQTHLPYAENVWTVVDGALDRYAHQYLAAKKDACEATYVRHIQSAELLDRRNECLASRVDSLRATAEVFRSHPVQAAQRSSAALASLADLAVCADPALLRLGLPLPATASTLAELRGLRAALARATALLAAADVDGAGQVIAAAAARARRLDYLPARGEVLRLQGLLAIERDQLAAGVTTLREALDVATESRHDELAADVWLALARAGPRHQALDEPRLWLRQADAWLRRLGHPGDWRRIDLARARGDLQAAAGEPREAVVTFTQALAAAHAASIPAEGVHVVPLLRGRAHAFAALGDGARAAADYREALARGIAAWGPAHPDVAATRRALGLLMIERLDEVAAGVREVEEARRVLGSAQGEDSTAVAECEQVLSQAGLFRGDYAGALTHALAALGIYERRLGPAHRRRGEALLGVGVLRHLRKDYAGALDAYERARAVLEANLGPEHVDVGVLLSNIGETLLALGENDEAILAFERALAILRHGKGPEHPHLAVPLKGLGLAYLARRSYPLARMALESALRLTARGGGDPRERTEIHQALARTLAALGRKAPAAHARHAHYSSLPRSGKRRRNERGTNHWLIAGRRTAP